MGVKAVEYCEKVFRNGWNYTVRTQDFTDEEIRKAVELVKPYNWDDLGDYLATLTDNPEVLAHLNGFESAAEQKMFIEETKRIQRECSRRL